MEKNEEKVMLQNGCRAISCEVVQGDDKVQSTSRDVFRLFWHWKKLHAEILRDSRNLGIKGSDLLLNMVRRESSFLEVGRMKLVRDSCGQNRSSAY